MRQEAILEIFSHVAQEPRAPFDNNPDFVTFSVAVTEKWKGKDGEEKENTQWYEVVSNFKNTSANIMKYLKKGDPVWLRGNHRAGEYTAKDGTTKAKNTLVLKDFKMLGSAKDKGEYQAQDSAPKGNIDLDDEIPF